MSKVADEKDLLGWFEDLDCPPKEYFRQKLSMRRYQLGNDISDHWWVRVLKVVLSVWLTKSSLTTVEQLQQPSLDTKQLENPNVQRLLRPIRPAGFHGVTAVLFISLFVSLMITLAALFAKSRLRGELQFLLLTEGLRLQLLLALSKILT
jgi:hypothetical protein